MRMRVLTMTKFSLNCLSRKLFLISALVAASFIFAAPIHAEDSKDYGEDYTDSSDVKKYKTEPAPTFPMLLKAGTIVLDSKEDGPLDISVDADKCPNKSFPYLNYAIAESHLNEDGFTMGFRVHIELKESGSKYRLEGEIFEIDDSSGRPHDWVRVNWQIWCTAEEMEIQKDEISELEHDP